MLRGVLLFGFGKLSASLRQFLAPIADSRYEAWTDAIQLKLKLGFLLLGLDEVVLQSVDVAPCTVSSCEIASLCLGQRITVLGLERRELPLLTIHLLLDLLRLCLKELIGGA